MFKQCVENEILLVVAESRGVAFDELQREVRDRTLKADFQVSILQIKRLKKMLVKYGFIEEKPPQTKNNPSTEINLTLSGLFRVLESLSLQEMADDSLCRHLDKIAINQGRKLLPFFNPYLNNREIGIKILRKYFNLNVKGYHQTPQQCFINELARFGFKEMKKAEFEEYLLESFYDFIFLINPETHHSFTEEETKQWDRALAMDSETRKYAIERLQIRREEYMPKVNYANQRIRFFEDSQPVA